MLGLFWRQLGRVLSVFTEWYDPGKKKCHSAIRVKSTNSTRTIHFKASL